MRPFLAASLFAAVAVAAHAQERPYDVRERQERLEDEAARTATSETFSRLHRVNRTLMDLGEEVRERGGSPAARHFAGDVLREHTVRDSGLVAFSTRHRIDLGPQEPVSGNLKAADDDANRALHRLRAMAGPELDRAFVEAVIDLDRDMLRVAEDGRREATGAGTRAHLDDVIDALRGEMGEAERVQREIRHEHERE